ncbi:M16 family metallopeptidase [Sphingomonas oligophenolica]|uniref:Insulinase family protein n=1 Tax=Sphingomonas oligophenolica TaxID=301154 RepID=A0A502CMP3_9SPHN|nr:M16 family metallopeptidase [Sphingomonas oligophenolica]TPG14467.1 insulinase family protein [Sphingomonas oligophenolica]
MSFRSRAFAPFIFLALASPIAGQSLRQAVPTATAAARVPVDTSAWLYKGSDLPHDPAWQFGTLPNGLRYAVRKNGVPPGQVSIRVRIDAGSLEETESQRGFAHFIEHLSFRGSEYVPDGEAKRVWQRFGAAFGSDTNAQTSPTQTVYKLDLPSATQATLDESIKILSGMMEQPVISDASVAAERPVVLAEQREQPGPQVRFGNALNQLFFAGQPLADRSPIGNITTLEAATGDSVRAFHDRWYRPSRAVVIISGDMDPALLSSLIVKHFAGWQGKGAEPPVDPDFGTPDATKPVAASIVEPGLPPLVLMGVLRPWHFNNDTAIFNQTRMIDVIATKVISRRLERRARAGASYVQAGVDIDDRSRSANITSVTILPVGDQWEQALKDVRAVIADAKAAPPTQVEIDREYADYDAALKAAVQTATIEASAKQADDMAGALDIRETVTAPQFQYDILTQAKNKHMFTPATVFAATKKIFDGVATRAIVNTRTLEPRTTERLTAALNADVTGLAGKRNAQGAVDMSKLPALGTPGTVVSRAPVDGLPAEQVVFSNGVRLLLFSSPEEAGRVFVKVRFGGGYNALPADRRSAAWAGDLALMEGGIGNLGQNDIDQLTAGRRLALDFGMDDDAFSMAALSSPQDYADELTLMAAKLAHPRWDAAPIARAKAAASAAIAGYDASADGVLSRDLEGLLHAGDPRWTTPDQEAIDALTPASFRALWEPLLASGPIEVDVFGDVKPDAVIAAVAKSFGAIPPRIAATGPVPPVRFPAHAATPVTRYHSGAANQAEALIAWPTGAGMADYAESRRLDILALVFSDRLFEKMRQAAGASYSPGVSSQWPKGLPGGGRLVAMSQVAPANVPLFFRMARDIAADLAKNPVTEDELNRVKGPLIQQIQRAASSSAFWLQQMSGGTYDPSRIAVTRAIGTDYNGVTPAVLQQTAATYLVPGKDWTMVVLPKAK